MNEETFAAQMGRISEGAAKALSSLSRMQFPHAFGPGRVVELDLSEPIEMIEVKGWRLQFIPSQGDFSGRPISRVFVTIDGELGKAKRVCRARYGLATHILAGAALHLDAKFGEWDA